MNDAAEHTQPETPMAQHWETIQAMFKTRTAMRPTRAWFNAISTRLSRQRLAKLRKSKGAKKLDAYLEQLSFKQIKTLRTYAAINQEQALAAFRLTLIANITAPLALVAFVHQVTNGGLPRIVADLQSSSPGLTPTLIGAVIGFVIAVLFVLIYAIASLGQARDLRHLMDIYAADRGIYFGLEDMDDLNLS